MSKVTKKQLHAQLNELNVKYTRKHTVAQLQQLLAAAQQPQRKQRASTKTILRNLFSKVGTSYTVDEVVAHVQQQHAVQAATVATMIGDLRNVKYACGPTINIVRDGNNYIRKD